VEKKEDYRETIISNARTSTRKPGKKRRKSMEDAVIEVISEK
jgi:hypothetical protein